MSQAENFKEQAQSQVRADGAYSQASEFESIMNSAIAALLQPAVGWNFNSYCLAEGQVPVLTLYFADNSSVRLEMTGLRFQLNLPG